MNEWKAGGSDGYNMGVVSRRSLNNTMGVPKILSLCSRSQEIDGRNEGRGMGYPPTPPFLPSPLNHLTIIQTTLRTLRATQHYRDISSKLQNK